MVEVNRIEEVEHANPVCNCCLDKAEMVIVFTKDVDKSDKLISLCGDCYVDLQKKMNNF